jgi:ferredoxin
MITLPPMPERIARLHRDERGYPVPWFICWMDGAMPVPAGQGKPDFRVIGPNRLAEAYNNGRCWICGGSMAGHSKVFVIGPMCVVNRVTSEPPNHRECAEFAAKACPFMINPREKRNNKNMIDNPVVAGEMIPRNPGAVALYQTAKGKPFQAGQGVLFQLGKPIRVDWYAEGRVATRAEIEASIDSGLPLLIDMAKKQGMDAVRQLAYMHSEAMTLLPAA